MIQYANRIQDPHTASKIREMINVLNALEQQAQANTEAVSSIAVPSLADIVKALSLGGSNPINVTGLQGTLANPQPTMIIGTHATRLTTPPPVGVFFLETDRASLYAGELIGSTPTWVWAGGQMVAALASRPADLGTSDAGFLFTDSTANTQTQYVWTGTLWVTVGGYLQLITDAVTNTITTLMLLKHMTSGTAAAGFGGAEITQLQNAAGSAITALYRTVAWTTATAGSEAANYDEWLVAAGVLTKLLTLASNGDLTLQVGNYLWKAGTSFTGKLTHGNTANRTYTFSDADGNVVYETASLTNNALVLGGGNALVKAGPAGTTTTVLHGNASGAPTYGAVDLTADVTGVLPVANGGAYFKSLFDHYADAGNVTTGETDLYSDTIVAGTLANNGDKLEAQYGGIFVSSATATRQIRVYFGGSVWFNTGTLTISSAASWTIEVTVIRESATVVRVMVTLATENAALSAYTNVDRSGGINTNTDLILKITGQAAGAGAATNDIVAKIGAVAYVRAA